MGLASTSSRSLSLPESVLLLRTDRISEVWGQRRAGSQLEQTAKPSEFTALEKLQTTTTPKVKRPTR